MTTLPHTTFSEADIAAFMPEMKIGLLATVNDQGLPHLTLSAMSCARFRQVYRWQSSG